MELRIKNSFLKLNELHEQCEKEIALKEYITCVKRLLNGVMQMLSSQFMIYEKKIMCPAIDVFVEQFIEQTGTALSCTDEIEKIAIIKDIENSLVEMLNVYKNVIGSTTNSDHKVFQTKGIDTNMYEVSPKKCVYYTGILNELVQLFDENDGRYAFILHPTIRNKIEACLLFKKREKPGRVVIIYVPEYCIEAFDMLPVHLIHEAFHVTTRKSRLRKLRAKCYVQHMVLAVEQLLFHGIDQDKLNKTMRRELLDFWFEGLKPTIEEISSMDETDRRLYSESFAEYFVKKLKEVLISTDNRIVEGIEKWYYNDELTYNTYLERREVGITLANMIRKNLFAILCNNHLDEFSDVFMYIYREGYADICCLRLLELSAEWYEKTFENALYFQVDRNKLDYVRILRSMLVAQTVFSQTREEDWSTSAEQYEVLIHENRNNLIHKSEIAIELNDEIIELYMEYFGACANEFSNCLTTKKEFKDKIVSVMKMEQEEVLSKIMFGWNIDNIGGNKGGMNIANND